MGVTKPYKYKWSGDIHGPTPYKLEGFRWAFIPQTPQVKRSAGIGPQAEVDQARYHRRFQHTDARRYQAILSVGRAP